VVPPPSPRLVVVQALPKGDRAELAVQAMTEVGVDEIVPWQASRSIVRWQGDRGTKALDRWRATAREAAKQSRRAHLPVVSGVTGREVVERLRGFGLALHEEASTPLSTVDIPSSVTEVVLVVGPEGGIAPEELDAFTAAGATPVRLGSTVLRTSTAGVAALAVLNARTGRWA
jgi:16S rRNA (uracil1498-N3)-methyltransferase